MLNNWRFVQYILVFSFLFGHTQLYAHGEAASQPADSERLFTRRIVWSGGEYALRFAVEVDKLEEGNYRSYIREYTQTHYFVAALSAGEYRFRIIPYDILGRPHEATDWSPFVVAPRLEIADLPEDSEYPEIEEIRVIVAEEIVEELAENGAQLTIEEELTDARRAGRFNTVGVSVGTCFTDPLIIAVLHGTYSPFRNFYIEIGCDIGFLSVHDYIDRFYSIYPFVNIGSFFPITNTIGIFAGGGAGLMIASFAFERRFIDIGILGANFFAGINVLNAINVTYTLRTDFRAISHRLTVGYVYRFR